MFKKRVVEIKPAAPTASDKDDDEIIERIEDLTKEIREITVKYEASMRAEIMALKEELRARNKFIEDLLMKIVEQQGTRLELAAQQPKVSPAVAQYLERNKNNNSQGGKKPNLPG